MDAASRARCTALSPRAVRRLQLAAGLMRGRACDIDDPRQVLAWIAALPVQRRDHLRSLVDWVEAYETASGDDDAGGGVLHRCGGPGRG